MKLEMAARVGFICLVVIRSIALQSDDYRLNAIGVARTRTRTSMVVQSHADIKIDSLNKSIGSTSQATASSYARRALVRRVSRTESNAGDSSPIVAHSSRRAIESDRSQTSIVQAGEGSVRSREKLLDVPDDPWAGFHPATTLPPTNTTIALPPTNCVWGEWGDWSECSTTCGANGVKNKTRRHLIEASEGGLPCTGDSEHRHDCNIEVECPVAADAEVTPSTTKEAAAEQAPPAEEKGGVSTVTIFIIVIILLGGGGGGVVYVHQKESAKKNTMCDEHGNPIDPHDAGEYGEHGEDEWHEDY